MRISDSAEVAEILLPEDDIERFEALREKAVTALKEIAPIVREAIRCRLSGEDMRWPDPMEDPGPASAADEALSDGFLIDSGSGPIPNDHHGRVKRASQAVGTLADELSGQEFRPDFYEWFESKYDGPPDLGQRAIWRSVFKELGPRWTG